MSWNVDLLRLAEVSPPPFHDKNLSLFSWWKNGLFLSGETEVVKDVDIDLSKIVGHAQGYPPMTWNYMLNNLKRINKRLDEVKRNPNYYLERLGSDVTYLDIDGQLFISTGKHRTTIAKYLTYYNPHKFTCGPIITGVDVIRYEVNHSLIDQVEKLKSKLRAKEFKHLELSWVGHSNPFSNNRFKLANNLRTDVMPLFVDELDIHTLFEMLDSSKSFIKALRSERINYLRRPLDCLLLR